MTILHLFQCSGQWVDSRRGAGKYRHKAGKHIKMSLGQTVGHLKTQPFAKLDLENDPNMCPIGRS